MTLKYSNLALFDEQTLEDTRQNWTAFAGSHSVFALECGPIFDWMEERLGEEKTLETVAYGLFESGYTTAAAIVEVVNSAKTKGPMIKMLKVDSLESFTETFNKMSMTQKKTLADIAIEKRIEDYDKCELIRNSTGINIRRTIELDRQAKEQEKAPAAEPEKKNPAASRKMTAF